MFETKSAKFNQIYCMVIRTSNDKLPQQSEKSCRPLNNPILMPEKMEIARGAYLDQTKFNPKTYSSNG
tara:strand:+ start:8953 stop:9156 length:204 start_codon:yes stop_codon:yes gene_type:complete